MKCSAVSYFVEWNNTTYPISPKRACVHEVFEEQAYGDPRPWQSSMCMECLTFEELNRRANQVGHYLQESFGVGPEIVVGICTERSLEMIIGLLGILKAGRGVSPC